MSNPRFKLRWEIAWPCLLAVTITWCSGYPAAVPSPGWFEIDKLGHFAAYGALATGLVRIPELKRWPGIGWWWAIILASAYGMGDEFRQSLTAGVRSCDWHDWVADTLGATAAVSLYALWPAYRRLFETKLWSRRPKPRVEIASEPLPNPSA